MTVVLQGRDGLADLEAATGRMLAGATNSMRQHLEALYFGYRQILSDSRVPTSTPAVQA